MQFAVCTTNGKRLVFYDCFLHFQISLRWSQLGMGQSQERLEKTGHFLAVARVSTIEINCCALPEFSALGGNEIPKARRQKWNPANNRHIRKQP